MRPGWNQRFVEVLLVGALSFDVVAAAQKALANTDVIEMVKGGLPDSTIIRVVQSGANTFDVSPSALIELHAAGVNEKIMEAMISASNRQAPRTAGARRSTSSTKANETERALGQPSVLVMHGATKSTLPLVRTSLAQTHAKASSLAKLTTEKMIDEATSTGVTVARRAGGRIGGAAGQAAKGVAGMLRGGDEKTLTYVWVLGSSTELPVVQSASPAFEVALNGTVGVNPADYAPVVVKLTPTAQGAFLVGATEGKTRATSDRAIAWPLYSGFVEDRVDVRVTTAASAWSVAVPAALQPGDYAVVLRPVAKDKKFAGTEVARNQGDGLVFNSAWPFSIR